MLLYIYNALRLTEYVPVCASGPALVAALAFAAAAAGPCLAAGTTTAAGDNSSSTTNSTTAAAAAAAVQWSAPEPLLPIAAAQAACLEKLAAAAANGKHAAAALRLKRGERLFEAPLQSAVAAPPVQVQVAQFYMTEFSRVGGPAYSLVGLGVLCGAAARLCSEAFEGTAANEC
jgi:hypothetical protein